MNSNSLLFANLSRINFAWEILRRIPAYVSDYHQHLENKQHGCCDYCRDASKWGLLTFHKLRLELP